MRFLCLTFFSLLFLHYLSHAQRDPIVTGTHHELESVIMEEKRAYAVYLPPSYGVQPEKSYPVLYVLDGNETRLRGVSGMVEELAGYDLSQQLPEFIVVAIPNTNRSRDLTPTKADLAYNGTVLAPFEENSGGADRFADFLEQELIPQIDDNYRTNEKRGLLGMSFGGLFAGHVLLTRPALFSEYLIADATFIWDENYLNRQLQQSQQLPPDHQLRVFIALANNDHIGDHGIANRLWGDDFIRSLKALSSENMQVTSRYFSEESHGTVVYLAFYHGLISLYGD